MHGFAAGIRRGDWVTAERVRGYSIILLVLSAIALVALVATAEGLNDYKGRPLGTDFSNVYAAGKWVLEGRPEAPFDPELQHAMEKRLFGEDTPLYGWHYPPVFLGIAAALALLPYLSALVVWQAATLAAYLAMIRAIMKNIPLPLGEADPRSRRGGGPTARGDLTPPGVSLREAPRFPERGEMKWLWLLPALAFPAVFINIAHGHNGFLTAALFGGGLLLLDRKPAIAGILIGLLCYKPQFGLLIPLVLVATARWNAFWTAAATVVVAAAMSWLAFGTDTWLAFRDSLEFTRTVVLEQGGTGFYKIQSPFAAARLWGAPVEVAYAVQGAAIAAIAVLLTILWRSDVAFEIKAAALLAGALISTPYLLDYDLVLSAPAIAFLAAHGLQRGFLPYEKTSLVFCWFAPLLSREAAAFLALPLGLIGLTVLLGVALRRGVADRAALPPS
jgi:alpha-1,2-mannosyltransferase